jgi:hypothetical protein
MSANGKRRPPRPQIEVLTGGASKTETAAIAAALEQFLAETAPSPATAPRSGWQRAALEEGVGLRDAGGRGWGIGLTT